MCYVRFIIILEVYIYVTYVILFRDILIEGLSSANVNVKIRSSVSYGFYHSLKIAHV